MLGSISNDSIVGNIRYKVTDGEILLSISAMSHNVILEGTFVSLNLSKEQAINLKAHL